MSNESTKRNWPARIAASLVVVLGVVGGLTFFNTTNPETAPAPVVIATSCKAFEADARKLFDKSSTATLSGKFAPGDHVHLAIDIMGVGYTWELSGVLAKPDTAQANGKGSLSASRIRTTTVRKTDSTAVYGRVSGYTTLELEIDVTAAGDGAIMVDKATGIAFAGPAQVSSAKCTATKTVGTVAELFSERWAALR